MPHGLKGTAIPLGARILAVANAFDVLTSPPAVGRLAPLTLLGDLPCSAAQALALLQASVGREFDPQVVAALGAEIARPGGYRRPLSAQAH